jgi:hypothetical protein
VYYVLQQLCCPLFQIFCRSLFLRKKRNT